MWRGRETSTCSSTHWLLPECALTRDDLITLMPSHPTELSHSGPETGHCKAAWYLWSTKERVHLELRTKCLETSCLQLTPSCPLPHEETKDTQPTHAFVLSYAK